MTLWNDVSIGRKLYLVIGTMALLIACELATLRFAMRTLSAVRAFVAGEGTWSKAQKDAALSLQRYALTGDEEGYQRFLEELRVPEGDHRARVELEGTQQVANERTLGHHDLVAGIEESEADQQHQLVRAVRAGDVAGGEASVVGEGLAQCETRRVGVAVDANHGLLEGGDSLWRWPEGVLVRRELDQIERGPGEELRGFVGG